MDNNYEIAMGLDLDSSGNIYMAGMFTGQMDFGPIPVKSTLWEDCFVAKLDAQANHIYSHAMTGPARQRCTAIAAGPNGDAVVVADFDGDMTLVDKVHTAVWGSFVVAKLGPAGARKWSFDYAAGEPWWVDVSSSGAPLVVGKFSTALTLGGLGVTGGAYDVFMALLPP